MTRYLFNKVISQHPYRFAILGVLALGILLAPFPRLGGSPVERRFRIQASAFQFTPAVLSVNPGDRVTIDLVSTDVVHGLAIDGYRQEVTAEPGQTARLTFTADRPGVFTLRCPVACGNLHPFMVGKLQVGPDQLFWRALAMGVLIALAGIWSLL